LSTYEGYPLLPETERDGFVFGVITPLAGERGAGFVQGPDGTRAGLQWELSDSPFLERIAGPDGAGWGVYRAGFTRPMGGVADLVANLAPVLPKLKVLYSRLRRQ
jgi:hypothetical protein